VQQPAGVAKVPPDLAENRRRRVGGELQFAVRIEAVDRLQQTDRADLDDVLQGRAASGETPSQVPDERRCISVRRSRRAERCGLCSAGHGAAPAAGSLPRAAGLETTRRRQSPEQGSRRLLNRIARVPLPESRDLVRDRGQHRPRESGAIGIASGPVGTPTTTSMDGIASSMCAVSCPPGCRACGSTSAHDSSTAICRSSTSPR